jgi:hypothetical protein
MNQETAVNKMMLEIEIQEALLVEDRYTLEERHEYLKSTIKQKLQLMWVVGYDHNFIVPHSNGCKKPVTQFGSDMKYIAEYPSAKFITDNLKISKHTILNALKDNHLTRQGYYWFYTDELLSKSI